MEESHELLSLTGTFMTIGLLWLLFLFPGPPAKLTCCRPSMCRAASIMDYHSRVITSDTWHMTHDTWYMTHDTWHMTCCLNLGSWVSSPESKINPSFITTNKSRNNVDLRLCFWNLSSSEVSGTLCSLFYKLIRKGGLKELKLTFYIAASTESQGLWSC